MYISSKSKDKFSWINQLKYAADPGRTQKIVLRDYDHTWDCLHRKPQFLEYNRWLSCDVTAVKIMWPDWSVNFLFTFCIDLIGKHTFLTANVNKKVIYVVYTCANTGYWLFSLICLSCFHRWKVKSYVKNLNCMPFFTSGVRARTAKINYFLSPARVNNFHLCS